VLPSILTAVCFAFSVVFARRSVAAIGSGNAFLARQVVAVMGLGAFAHLMGAGLQGAGFWYFFLGGVVGFGMGDFALYRALPLIGSRLTILLCQCLAAPIGAGIEWAWLGTRLTSLQVLAGGLILVGVALALAPAGAPRPRAGEGVPPSASRILGGWRAWGVFWGCLAAFGQAYGAVLSRKAYQLEILDGFVVDGATAAYQRLLGGLFFGLGFHLLTVVSGESADRDADPGTFQLAPAQRWRRAAPWILLNALTGAGLGVSCYQWALATTPSGVVLPIVATTPLMVIPLAYALEGDRPTGRALAGACLAVIGASLLAWAS
jgi:drug/metabolite transporter (DMT)-like permease